MIANLTAPPIRVPRDEGYGLVWNPGQDPVEGYTSFLWVLVGALGHLLPIDPLLFGKLVAAGSGAVTVIGIYLYARVAGVTRSVALIAGATLAFSPAFALLTAQGMETALATLLVLASAAAAVELTKQYRDWLVNLLCGTLLLGMLTQPGLVIYSGGILLGLFGFEYYAREGRHVHRLFGYATAWLLVPGLLYTGARYLYFGYFFPNPFYVKQSSGIISLLGSYNVFEFSLVVLGPPIFIGLLSIVRVSRSEALRRLERVGPVVVGVLSFLGLWFFMEPATGFLWRFQMPVAGAILLGFALLTRSLPPSGRKINLDSLLSRPSPSSVIVLLLIGLLVVYPVHTYVDARTHYEDEYPERTVGKALNAYDGEGYTMFVTESGRVPYYSEWDSADEWGLTSEEIAHHGLDREYLERLNPDVIMLAVTLQADLIRKKSPPTARYLAANDYRLTAVMVRTDDSRHPQLYYVKHQSPGYREVTCTLLTTEGLTYGERDVIVGLSSIDVPPAELSPADCSS